LLVVAQMRAGQPAWHIDSLLSTLYHSLDWVERMLRAACGAPKLQLNAVHGVPQQDNFNDCGWFTVARTLDIINQPDVLWHLVSQGQQFRHQSQHQRSAGVE
jgi:hypothetical protein